MSGQEATKGELPKGWTSVALSEIASNRSGNSKLIKGKLSPEPTAENPFPGFSASGPDVWLKGYDHEGKAIIVSAVGARCGKAFEADGKWSAIANTHIVRPNLDVLEPKLFWYLLNDESFWEKGGSAQPFVKVNKTFERHFNLPPLAEQKRIADKLEKLLGRVAACRARLDRVPTLLKRFRQSVLAAATSGKLTEEWRRENGVNDQWRTGLFEDFCEDITVGFVGKMSDAYRESGVPFLRSLNVRPFKFDSRELKYVSVEFHRSIQKSALRPGDVVVVRTGAPGQCCVIPSELEEANCSDLVIVRCGSELLPRFAVVFINSETSQDFVKSERVGVAQAHFNVGSMKRAPLHLPTLPEQHEIVRRVEELLGFADRIESRLAAARKTVERLMPAVLAKAFRGKLVPQDPADEPAAALLERIGSERGPTSPAKRGRGRRPASA